MPFWPIAGHLRAMDLDLVYPAVSDLRAKARRRIPHFAFEYLDSGTGAELQVQRNRDALDAIHFMPDVLVGDVNPAWDTDFMGQSFSRPFGIAPIGMSGVMWPGAERILAQAAARHSLPYCLSTVATKTPEDIAPHHGGMGWFQLYVPTEPDIRQDILKRAKEAGFTKLVFTLDVPDDSRRERQRRAQLSLPPVITARTVWDIASHPRWALATLKEGKPSLKLADSYVEESKSRSSLAHAGHLIRGKPDWETLARLREEWDGDLILKGVMDPALAKRLMAEGGDGIWVSNHGGRQFEPGPAAIDTLAAIRAALPDAPLIFDSGIASGMDVLRALALGADFVMMGRAWHYAVSALGPEGPDHLVHILTEDMKLNMAQIGAHTLADLPRRLIRD
ncbi:MAG: alpha-hydroxy acid oxidase [Pseudomonadota bacterium]